MNKAFIRLLLLTAIWLFGSLGQQVLGKGLTTMDPVVGHAATGSVALYSSSVMPQILPLLPVRGTVNLCCNRPDKSQPRAGHCDNGHCNDAPHFLPFQNDVGFLDVAKRLMSPTHAPLVAVFSAVTLRPPPRLS